MSFRVWCAIAGREEDILDMEVRTFLLVIVGFLGSLSGLLSFIAEGKKLVESNVTRVTSNECVHARSPALVLGLTAAIALLFAQVISNALGGCICCENGPYGPNGKNTSTALAVGFLTFSWVTFSIAFLLLVAGASINDRRDTSDNSLSTGCFVLKSGVFTGAGFAALTTALLGIAYNLQVFSIRKTMASTPMPCSGSEATSIGSAGMAAMNSRSSIIQKQSVGGPSEGVPTARVVQLPLQKQKTRTERSAFPRAAVNVKRGMRAMEVSNKPGRADDRPTSIQTRKSLLALQQQQGYTNAEAASEDASRHHPQGSESPALQETDDYLQVGHYNNKHHSQSALAAYNMDIMNPHFEEDDQEPSQPLYRRAGGGNVWELQ